MLHEIDLEGSWSVVNILTQCEFCGSRKFDVASKTCLWLAALEIVD